MTAISDPNLATLEKVAEALRPILHELVLVGGCSVSLLITDKAQAVIRPTIDVDLITEATPLSSYYSFCDKLRSLDFRESDEVTCRWLKGGLIIDVMPTDEKILGFTNTWYPLGVKTATKTSLPSGVELRHVTAPLFVATKLESFNGRGKGDFAHHDIEDIVTIIDGRQELYDDVQSGPKEAL